MLADRTAGGFAWTKCGLPEMASSNKFMVNGCVGWDMCRVSVYLNYMYFLFCMES